MNLEPVLKALADALHGDGPAVQLQPGATPGADPVLTLIPQEELALGFGGALDGEIAAVVATSGSTGTPKRTMLSVDALAASSVGTAMALGGEGQWLLALPVHYVAGLQVLVRSLFAGTRPWAMDLSNGFTPEAFTEAAGELTDKLRYTSLVPTQLARLLEDPSVETLSALRRFNAVLLGGAPASRALLDAARDAGVRVVTTYGMSETSGGCVYDGVPLEGVQVSVRDGRVWLGGDVVAAGYLSAPTLTAASFTDEDSQDGPVRWYQTGDLGQFDADGRLDVLGRADDVIITGGLKVAAHAVAEALTALPGVREAFVAGVEDTQWGQRVAAAVVPDGSTGPLSAAEVKAAFKEAVKAAATAAMEPHTVPKTLLVLDELPLLASGKPDRKALAALLAAGAADNAETTSNPSEGA
ncbi:o-succinylbenzoate--CoA ligase [Arthrobacter sp. 35W]|uniref:o-succinylbenzoate--CoA ligase n=1 Tax=Arthrobacter sp. 35W TaxID=1132441 RepID=UPI000401612C|nr:o-succinylbenzoate--CoA ligase [Arthrobacter sp. 35W]